MRQWLGVRQRLGCKITSKQSGQARPPFGVAAVGGKGLSKWDGIDDFLNVFDDESQPRQIRAGPLQGFRPHNQASNLDATMRFKTRPDVREK